MEIANIDSSAFKDLRCEICKDYLLHFPIFVCSNGLICGKCESSLEHKALLTRYSSLPLENILKRITFSCMYKDNGCDYEFTSEYAKEHERKCVYRKSSCPRGECEWKGLLIEMQMHFYHEHWVCDYENVISININSKSEFEDCFVISVQEDIPFIIKYQYCCDTEVLSYNISYLCGYITNASHKISKDSKELIEGESFPYAEDATLNEIKVEKLLNSTLTINLKFEQYPWSVTDPGLLETLKCFTCRGFLIPQPYHSKNFELVCGLCANDKTAISKLEIADVVKKTSFPCKWVDCTFISNAVSVFKHQKSCRYRTYSCAMRNYKEEQKRTGICNAEVSLVEMKEHLSKSHTSKFMTSPKCCTVANEVNRYFNIKLGAIINIDVYLKQPENIIYVEKTRMGDNSIDHSAYVQFSHNHCRNKSKWFHIDESARISSDSLPPCFQCFDQFINATVKIS